MENKFRNELEIELGGQKILLRPTMENVAAMESAVGSVAYLVWKYSRGSRVSREGNPELAVKSMPSMTDTAKIFYYNQAATKPDDATQKKFSLEEIWDFVLQEGASSARWVLIFLGNVTMGNRAKENMEEITEGEKKS